MGWNSGSTRTEPVKYWSDPLLEGWDPLRVTVMPWGSVDADALPAGPSRSESAVAVNRVILEPPGTIGSRDPRFAQEGAGPVPEGCEPLRLISIWPPPLPAAPPAPRTKDSHGRACRLDGKNWIS